MLKGGNQIKRLILIAFLLLFLVGYVFIPHIFEKKTTYEKNGIIVLEVVPYNKSLKHDELINFGDYIKIYNNSDEAVNLENYSLTDDFSSPDKWQFPSFEMGPYEQIYVFLDGKDIKGRYLHTNFSLNNEGEEIWLKDCNDNDILKWKYESIGADVSYSLIDGEYELVDKNRYKDIEINYSSFTQYTALQGANTVGFSSDSGFYSEEFDLKLSTENDKCVIRYTLDGSDPTLSSQMYTLPITITSRDGDENEFISSSVAYEGTSASANYTPKPENTKRATIIKAAAFLGSQRVGEVFTNTYFVDDKGEDLYALPVVSLVCDPDDLFSGEDGIYVIGDVYEAEAKVDIFNQRTKSSPANYNQRGEDWRRPCNFEYFEQSKIAYEHSLGIQIFGGASRGESKKSFKILTKTFSEEKIQYPFFAGLEDAEGNGIDTFEELILRNGGSLTDGLAFLDNVHSRIASNRLETQASNSVVVFLNGNYYGVYQLMEVLSDEYISNHYGVDEEDVEIFKTLDYDFELIENNYYESLVDFAANNDLSIQSNYEYIEQRVDIDNLLEYFVFQMYIGNTDWPSANNKVWRVKPGDGYAGCAVCDNKYRYVLFDTDCGMNEIGDFRFNDMHPTIFHWVFENKYPLYDQIGVRSLDIIEKLIKNDGFKQAFLNKFCDRVNVDYAPQVFYDNIDYIAAQVEPEMENDLKRYLHLSGSIGNWRALIQIYKDYVARRNDEIFTEMADYFGLGVGRLSVLESGGGHVNVNGNIDVGGESGFSGRYITGTGITLTAVPEEECEFSGWSDGVKEPVRQVVLNKEMPEVEVQAIFVKVR